MFFDDLDRPTFVAKNWDDFTPTSPSTASDSTDKSKDVVTGHVYNGLSLTTEMTVYAVGGNNQTTKYFYEDGTTGTVDARRVIVERYPDSTATNLTDDDQVKFEYNVDGTLKKKTDQRTTRIDYVYNSRRPLELEKVMNLGGSTDGHVKSIGRVYDDLARLERITSYPNDDGTGTARNEVKLTYNDLDQVIESKQSHEDTVANSNPPSVQYAYDADSSGSIFTRQHRLNEITYPSGRKIFYDFDTGNSTYPASRLSRIHSIRDTNSTGDEWSKYSYAATSRLAVADYPQITTKLDYTSTTTGQYPGLDRFGRIQDQRWWTGTTDKDRFGYAYDYAENRTYRDNTLASTKGQIFGYDGLHRLKSYDQGTLSFGPPAIASPSSEQDWSLDTLGNWSGFITKASGTTNLNQTRTVNEANEITDVSATVGTAGVDPVYDAAGNATTLPAPSNPAIPYTLLYDAWNRMVEVKATLFGTVTLEKYEYDGLNRRIVSTIAPASTNDVQHSYYNESWQELEVRKVISGTESPNPIEQFVWHPYYIDALATRFYDSDPSDSGGVVQHYFTHDANFNVTAVFSDSGAVIERYEYTPYGKATFLDTWFSPLMTQSSTISNSYLYTGRRLDATTGLYYYRNRYYHAEIGGFTIRDPIGYTSGDSNLYRYCENHPLRYVDPMGYTSCPPTEEEIKSGEAVPVGDLDGDGMTDYKFPNEPISKDGYTVYCYSRGGGGEEVFLITAPDGCFCHRCPYPGGQNKWKTANKGKIYRGSVTWPEKGETTEYYYRCEPKPKLTITVRACLLID